MFPSHDGSRGPGKLNFSFLSSRTLLIPFLASSVSGLLVIYLLFIANITVFQKLVYWVQLDKKLKLGFPGPLDPL